MWSYVWRAREDYHNFSVHYCVPQLCTMVPYAQNHEQFLHITTGSGLCLIFCVLHLFKLRPVCFVSVRDSFCVFFFVYLLRDAYAKRGLCGGKMSVRLSVTRRYCA